MKTITIAVSAAILFASAAVSAQENYSGYTDFVVTKTRAEVKAELVVALQRGEVASGEQYPNVLFDAAPQGKTRADVKAELIAAQQRGEISSGEQYANIALDPVPQAKTRAEVKAELAAYRNTKPAADTSL